MDINRAVIFGDLLIKSNYWRNTKLSTLDDCKLPGLIEDLHFLRFTPIERFSLLSFLPSRFSPLSFLSLKGSILSYLSISFFHFFSFTCSCTQFMTFLRAIYDESVTNRDRLEVCCNPQTSKKWSSVIGASFHLSFIR